MTIPEILLLLVLQASAAEVGTVNVGDRAPGFALPWATRDTISFSTISLDEKLGTSQIVLAFYPADWSGGCTKQMCSMRDDFAALSDLGAEVYGISGDYLFSHHEWAKHHQLQFPLLSDHSHKVARLYGSFDEESGYNRRMVFVIDKKGIVRYIDPMYKPGTAESLERLKDALGKLR